MERYKTKSRLIAGLTLFLLILFTETALSIPGDINNDKRVDLADAIMGLNILAGTGNIPPAADLSQAIISADQRLGLGEVIVVLQKLAGLRNSIFVALAAGERHTAALNDDGSVWMWGYNGEGQLGDGTSVFADRPTPGRVIGLSGIAAIASGDWHMAALKSDGTVWTWGDNWYGQLGLGDSASLSQSTPVRIGNLTGIIRVAGGGGHTTALKSDGTVWTWGDNFYGQLGDGTIVENRTTPVLVNNLTGVVQVACGGNHTVALKSDGTVWTWGDNFFGQLGDGTTVESRTTPARVNNLTGIIAVAGGANHTIALKSDGTVWTWGDNFFGQLGDGTTVESRTTPVLVNNLTGIVAVAGGGSLADDGSHTVALKSDGTVWTWGDNWYGQLGDGTGAYAERNTPAQVINLTRIDAVAGGGYHTAALGSDGVIWTWGDNTYGQLGDDAAIDRDTPAPVTIP